MSEIPDHTPFIQQASLDARFIYPPRIRQITDLPQIVDEDPRSEIDTPEKVARLEKRATLLETYQNSFQDVISQLKTSLQTDPLSEQRQFLPNASYTLLASSEEGPTIGQLTLDGKPYLVYTWSQNETPTKNAIAQQTEAGLIASELPNHPHLLAYSLKDKVVIYDREGENIADLLEQGRFSISEDFIKKCIELTRTYLHKDLRIDWSPSEVNLLPDGDIVLESVSLDLAQQRTLVSALAMLGADLPEYVTDEDKPALDQLFLKVLREVESDTHLVEEVQRWLRIP